MLRDYDAPRRQQLLGIAMRQSQVLATVVNDLLDLARIEAKRDVDFEFGQYELRALMMQVGHDFVPPPGRSAPEIDAGDVPSWVRVDRRKFEQVLSNLLSNAYKYSSDGAVQLRLLPPQPGPAGRRTGLQVQDHGIGMTPEQLARVGERFYRADASGHVLGTGLGMSIVGEFVALMQGTLVLASDPGAGTTVTVWLPCAEAGAAPAAASQPRVAVAA
jgi:signal transduction histidine kinase